MHKLGRWRFQAGRRRNWFGFGHVNMVLDFGVREERYSSSFFPKLCINIPYIHKYKYILRQIVQNSVQVSLESQLACSVNQFTYEIPHDHSLDLTDEPNNRLIDPSQDQSNVVDKRQDKTRTRTFSPNVWSSFPSKDKDRKPKNKTEKLKSFVSLLSFYNARKTE